MDLSLYTAGLEEVFNPGTLLVIIAGTTVGILIGALPGLSAMMGVAVLIPLTYGMSETSGILMLVGVYCGALYGGSISACLVNIPGTPSAVVTTLDGYPMSQRGEAGRSIGMSTFASGVGGLLSTIALVMIAPVIARFALNFTSYEMFSIAIFGITILAYISSGSMLKGLISGMLGLLIACVGADPINSAPRYTFDQIALYSGVTFVPAMIGFYGVAEILLNVDKSIVKKVQSKAEIMNVKHKRILPTVADLKKVWAVIIRSSFIGVIIGAIPGAGGTIASIVSYATQKKISKKPEEMGKGAIEGIAAAESANNACSGGAMITLLSLGIPGDAVTAILIGAFMVHGLVPGPLLFKNNSTLVSAIFLGMVIANITILALGLYGARYFAKIIMVPQYALNGIVIALCVVGTFAVQNSFYDIKVMLFFAVLGYVMTKLDFPRASLVLALILGPIMEQNFRRSLLIAGEDWGAFLIGFVNRPIALVIMIITITILLLPIFIKRDKNIIQEES